MASISANRHTEPAKLTKLVRGELDWIVMKTLEKDRNRRYETANGFAMDVQRYLADEPVQACPPSAGYRLRKFVRRNKGPVLAATLVLFALVGGIIGTAWGLVRAESARQAAIQRAEGERQAKQDAEAREAETEAVLEFVETKVFAAGRPNGQEGGLGREVQLRQALEAALRYVDQNLREQPLIEARLRMTLRNSLAYLGEPRRGLEQTEKARTLYTSHLGPDDRRTLRSTLNLGATYGDLGRHAEAIKLLEETLATQKAKLGADDPDTLMTMFNLAGNYHHVRRHTEALQLMKMTLALQEGKLGPDHTHTLRSMMGLATSYYALGQHTEALALREKTLALQKVKLGADHPETLASMNNLCNSYHAVGRHTEAVKLREETLALRERILGAGHANTLRTRANLANGYDVLGRYADALKLREETLELQRDNLGPDHPDTVRSMNNLAWSLATVPEEKLRDPARAVKLATKAVESSATDAGYRGTLGTARYRAGEWDNAIKDLEKAISLRNADDPKNANEGFFIAMAHWQRGRRDKAGMWYVKAVAWMEKNEATDARLHRFREETAALLKLKDEMARQEQP